MELNCIFLVILYQVSNIEGYGETQNKASLEQSKIVNGDIISIKERPYQVYITQKLNLGYYVCGGVIISEQWVLTAAHCVRDNSSDTIIRAGDVQNHTVSRVIQHPNYNTLIKTFDFAVMQVSTPFSIGQPGIAAIPIASSLPSTGTAVTASGWGRTRYYLSWKPSTSLRKADMKMGSPQWCRLFYFQNNIDNSTFCASGRENVWSGDSGGPLTVKTANGDQLIGLASVVKRRLAWFGGPALFANVPSARSWIKDTTGV